MTDKEIKKLANHIAQALIDKAVESSGESWKTDNELDHLVGELARCMTLQNVYEEREEYEKCAIMKIRVTEINKKLGVDLINEEDENGNEDET
tara:strand:+ start:1786 stop:2064 length:279 start_codon:yes stop_codon:yes gene_type:complete